MRIQIQDGMGYVYQIDSLHPDTLGKWLLEIFDRIRPDHVCPARVQVWPSWSPDGKEADFVVDNRVLGRLYQVRKPREVIERMLEMVKEAEELHS